MEKRASKILLSPCFVVGLFVLLLNDFFLKSYFGNFLTGKLSDFAGLFVFPLFWTAFFPKRKLFIFVSTAVFFVFWKSPFAQGFIDFWNSLGIFGIGRTVDYGDLIALTMLPAAWVYFEKFASVETISSGRRLARFVVAGVSLFAFTATSPPAKMQQMEEFADSYKITRSPLDVAKKLQEIKTDDFRESKHKNTAAIHFNIELNEKVCDGLPNAYFIVSGDKNNDSDVNLKHILYPCDDKLPDQNEKLKKMFETEVIDFLKNGAAS